MPQFTNAERELLDNVLTDIGYVTNWAAVTASGYYERFIICVTVTCIDVRSIEVRYWHQNTLTTASGPDLGDLMIQIFRSIDRIIDMELKRTKRRNWLETGF